MARLGSLPLHQHRSLRQQQLRSRRPICRQSYVALREGEREGKTISKSESRRRSRKAQRQYCPRGGNAWQADKHNFTAFFPPPPETTIFPFFFCYIMGCFFIFFFLGLKPQRQKRRGFFHSLFNCQLSVLSVCVFVRRRIDGCWRIERRKEPRRVAQTIDRQNELF